MTHRDPEINDWAILGRARRMLRAHERYCRVGESRKPAAAKIRTTVEVTVIQLTRLLPSTNPKREVPHASSRKYRHVITSTTRSGSGGKIGRKQKKQLRNDAYRALVMALDFLDS